MRNEELSKEKREMRNEELGVRRGLAASLKHNMIEYG
jgi:hypothetical protein